MYSDSFPWFRALAGTSSTLPSPRSRSPRTGVLGAIILALGSASLPCAAEVVPLSMTSGANYDAYITVAEANHAKLYDPPANWGLSSRMVNQVFGQHAAGATGRGYTWMDQTTSGLPTNGALTTGYGPFQLSLARDAAPAGGFVVGPVGSPPVLPVAPNVLRAFRPHAGTNGSPGATASVVLPPSQQAKYSSINFLVSGNNGKVLIYADYDNGAGGLDSQLIYQSPGTPLTTGETGFPEVVSSTSTNPHLVPALTMSKVWAQTSNYSNITSATATLWTFANPIPLDANKVLDGFTVAIYDADIWKTRNAVIYAASADRVATRPTFYVDAVSGNDTTGTGTSAAPFKTIGKVLPLLTGGQDVVLRNGSYGNVSLNKSGNIYSDWVTFKAAPGASPEIGRFTVEGPTGPTNQTGGYNAYIRLEGLKIRDGWYAWGAKNWALVNCLVERIGPWLGNDTDMHKAAIEFRNATNVLIEGCEVTNTGIGVVGRGHQITLRGCHIHHGTHDGVRVTGWWNSVVEDNLIHSFDDTVSDGEAAWSRHCDLIHIFIPGPATAGMENNNILFRNNVLYDSETQGVQFNNLTPDHSLWNKNITFENNVFGPTRANTFNAGDPVAGLVFRNNTVVYLPGRTFGRWQMDDYSVRFGAGTGIQVYNNLMVSVGFDGGEVLRFDRNTLQGIPNTIPTGLNNTRAFGRFDQWGVNPLFVNPGAFDGAVQASSPVINTGTRVPVIPMDDIHGTLRDLRADRGAFEFPGLTPPAEVLPVIHPGTKTIFVDDFEDGHFKDVDDWLNAPSQQGLSWVAPAGPYYFRVTTMLDNPLRNVLKSPRGASGVTRVAWTFSQQGANWSQYDLSFDAHNNYLASGSGPVVLAKNTANCYWLDIGRDTGKLYRTMGGTRVELASNAALRLPHSGLRKYKVMVRQVTGGIRIGVDVGQNGSEDFSFIDTNATAKATFTSGVVGVHDNTTAVDPAVHYDNFRVDVISVLP